MGFQSTERQGVLAQLHAKVGFPVSESELSPSIRQRVSELAGQKQRASFLKWELSQLSSKKEDYNVYFLLSLIAGVALAVIIVGLFILAVAYYFYKEKKKAEAMILQKSQEIETLNRAVDAGLSQQSQLVHSELSAAHEARLRPMVGVGTQILKETVLRELVMVPCSYCNSLMAQTALTCPYCGARRRA